MERQQDVMCDLVVLKVINNATLVDDLQDS